MDQDNNGKSRLERVKNETVFILFFILCDVFVTINPECWIMTPNVCRKTHILNPILNAVLMLENVEVLGKLLKAREVDFK